MADDAPDTGTAPPATPDTEPRKEPGKTFTQDQVNDLLALQKGKVERRFEGFDELKAKAEKLDEVERAQQSEMERLITERDGLKETLTPLQSENLRLKVALGKNLPAPLVAALQGDTQEEMETHADELLTLVGGKENEPATDFDAGARNTPPVQKTPEAAHADFLSSVLRAENNP